MGQRIRMPKAVRDIYRAVDELQAAYPGRKFTPDGHLVGSIGEVIAQDAFRLTLYSMSHQGHDAKNPDGRDVQIKLTAGSSISMYGDCDRLIVLRVVSTDEAEVIYDGDGSPVWKAAGKMQKNGQRTISLSKIRGLASSTRNRSG